MVESTTSSNFSEEIPESDKTYARLFEFGKGGEGTVFMAVSFKEGGAFRVLKFANKQT